MHVEVQLLALSGLAVAYNAGVDQPFFNSHLNQDFEVADFLCQSFSVAEGLVPLDFIASEPEHLGCPLLNLGTFLNEDYEYFPLVRRRKRARRSKLLACHHAPPVSDGGGCSFLRAGLI